MSSLEIRWLSMVFFAAGIVKVPDDTDSIDELTFELISVEEMQGAPAVEPGVEEVALVDQIPFRRVKLTLTAVLALHPLASVNLRSLRAVRSPLPIDEIFEPRALVLAPARARKRTLAVSLARLELALVLGTIR